VGARDRRGFSPCRGQKGEAGDRVSPQAWPKPSRGPRRCRGPGGGETPGGSLLPHPPPRTRGPVNDKCRGEAP